MVGSHRQPIDKFLEVLTVSDQGLVNCLDSGPCCSHSGTCMSGKRVKALRWDLPHFNHIFSVGRNLEVIEATIGRAASVHFGRDPAGPSHQQTEHVTS